MTYLATITSARQFTIPALLFADGGLFKPGEKVLVTVEQDSIKVSSALRLVNQLAGSIKIPSRYRGLEIFEIKERAKKEYFSKKYVKAV